MSSEKRSGAVGSTLIVALIATILGGVVLAFALPRIVGPNLKILFPDLATSTPGNLTWETLTLAVTIHNDGSASAANCTAHWEGRNSDGQPFFHRYSDIFYVPADSNAISLATNLPAPVPIGYDVQNQAFPSPPAYGDLVVYISCDGYRSSDWTIYSNFGPVPPA